VIDLWTVRDIRTLASERTITVSKKRSRPTPNTQHQTGIATVIFRRYRLDLVLAIFILPGLSVHSLAQLPVSAPPSPAKPEATKPEDPLGRGTPRGAMMGFLRCAEREEYENAASYLQPAQKIDTNLVQRAKELQALLQTGFKGNLGMLSDDANSVGDPGLPPGQIRAGVLKARTMTADVILVRIDDPVFGNIWLISKETVASIPKLYDQQESKEELLVDRLLPTTLSERRLLGMSLAQWVGWLLSIPASWLLASLLAFLISLPARLAGRFRKLPFTPVWATPVGMPLKCIIAILIHSLLVHLLRPPLLYRVYYFRFIAILLVACLAWLVSVIVDRGFEHGLQRRRTKHPGGESILILMQRLSRIAFLTIAVLIALAILGVNVKTTLAGLGIGGLAIALAAQRTLENLIGGVSLLMDRAVEVGDFCQIDDQLGTVEDIGLRSLKLRTLEQNLLVVPNGLLAQMQFKNMKCRRKLLINQKFSLRIETRAEQLRFVLDRAQSMLDEHPAIEPGTSRVRVIDLVGARFEIELFAYGKTGDWAQLTAIRQDVILKIAEIVEASGTRFAAPTQLTYLSTDGGIEMEKPKDIVRRVTEPRGSNKLRFPVESQTGTE
jgi:MscS family membrane protein